ncbi:MAG: hypothetical protein ACLQVJ_05360 [Syntrophobacteraceae bacterium]
MILLAVSNDTRIKGAASEVIKKLQDRFTLRNLQHEEKGRRGLSNWNVPRELCYLTQDKGTLTLQRCFTRRRFRSSEIPANRTARTHLEKAYPLHPLSIPKKIGRLAGTFPGQGGTEICHQE